MIGDSPKVDLLQTILGASSLRQRVIAGNIANQNTPGYVRKSVEFESVLRERLATGGDPSAVQPKIVEDNVTPAGPDGNNVTIESEMNALRENRLLYETYSTLMRGHFSLLETSIGR